MRNGSTIGLIVLGVVVLFGGVFAGYYYFGSGSSGRHAALPPANGIVAPLAPVAPPAPVVHRPAVMLGEYTAPGAPNIQIVETKAPIKSKPAPPPAPVDTESSQTGVANPPSATPADTSGSTSIGADGSTSADAANAASNTSAQGQDSGSTTDGASATDSGSDSSTTPVTTPPPPSTPPTAPAPPAFGAALFRVQAGAFQSQKNAQILQDALRHKGYAATTFPRQSDGAPPVYVVQVGAYSSRVTADETVTSLQHDGFPASVSTGP